MFADFEKRFKLAQDQIESNGKEFERELAEMNARFERETMEHERKFHESVGHSLNNEQLRQHEEQNRLFNEQSRLHEMNIFNNMF